MKYGHHITVIVRQPPAGQGLLEATLAIGMILVGLAAMLTLAVRNISAATDSSQRLVAVNLAREAIEVVRAKRDSNWLADSNSAPGTTWDEGLIPSGDGSGAIVTFDPISAPRWVVQFVDNRTITESEFELWRQRQDHQWVQDSLPPDPADWEATGWRRLLTLDPLCRRSSDSTTYLSTALAVCAPSDSKIGLEAKVEVSWPAAGLFGGVSRRSLTIVEYLYDWR